MEGAGRRAEVHFDAARGHEDGGNYQKHRGQKESPIISSSQALLPTDPDSQLNLASAALRFGQLDVARKALDRISTPDRNRAAFHVVAGWLARAEGNFVKQEEQFAAAVKEEPSNDLYQFNLAALQIHSTDPKKSTKARGTLDRISKVARFC